MIACANISHCEDLFAFFLSVSQFSTFISLIGQPTTEIFLFYFNLEKLALMILFLSVNDNNVYVLRYYYFNRIDNQDDATQFDVLRTDIFTSSPNSFSVVNSVSDLCIIIIIIIY